MEWGHLYGLTSCEAPGCQNSSYNFKRRSYIDIKTWIYLNKKRDSEVCEKFHESCCDTRHYHGLYNIPGKYQIIHTIVSTNEERIVHSWFNPLKPELNPICYLLALLGVHHFLHVSRIRVKLLTFMLLMSYIYGAPILDVSRSHTTTQHSR